MYNTNGYKDNQFGGFFRLKYSHFRLISYQLIFSNTMFVIENLYICRQEKWVTHGVIN